MSRKTKSENVARTHLKNHNLSPLDALTLNFIDILKCFTIDVIFTYIQKIMMLAMNLFIEVYLLFCQTTRGIKVKSVKHYRRHYLYFAS